MYLLGSTYFGIYVCNAAVVFAIYNTVARNLVDSFKDKEAFWKQAESNLCYPNFVSFQLYQFYAWYYHALPALFWLTRVPNVLKVLLICLVEYAFNVFTATQFSSAGCVTNLAHVSIEFHCNTACRCSNYCSTSALERIVEFTIHTSTRRPQNLYLMLTYNPLDWKKFLK